jgi:hypothetical protein
MVASQIVRFHASDRRQIMTSAIKRSRRCECLILCLTLWPILAASVALPIINPAWGEGLKLAQMRGYSASGTHQCGSEKGRSCVVTGSGFSNCNDATGVLQTRDCCPTTPQGGKSSGFTLNYCIPNRAL